MDMFKIIDHAKIESGVKTDKELAERIGWTAQSYNDKKRRGDMRVSDLEKVADALDCDLVITFEPREK